MAGAVCEGGRGIWYNELMKKLIVKTKLVDEKRFWRQAESIGMEVSPVVWQHERIYLPAEYKPHRNYPRLVMRTEVVKTDEPARYYLYLKRHIEDSGVDVVNFTAVGDYTEATGLVHQLGFRKVAEVSRQRQEVELDAKTRIYIDRVEGLEGVYLKIEVELDEGAGVGAMRKQIGEILGLLGQEETVEKTYAELMSAAD